MIGEIIRVFITGGLICLIGQILIDKTMLTPARIAVMFVVAGTLLTAVNLYEPLVKFGMEGATVPLTGFGYALGKGAIKAVDEKGWLGIFTGGVSATAGGVAAAVVAGYFSAILFTSKTKK